MGPYRSLCWCHYVPSLQKVSNSAGHSLSTNSPWTPDCRWRSAVATARNRGHAGASVSAGSTLGTRSGFPQPGLCQVPSPCNVSDRQYPGTLPRQVPQCLDVPGPQSAPGPPLPFPWFQQVLPPQAPLRACPLPRRCHNSRCLERRGEWGTSLTAVTWGMPAGRAHLWRKEGSGGCRSASRVVGGSWVVLAWPPPRSTTQGARERSAATCTLRHLRLQRRLLTAPHTPPPPHAPQKVPEGAAPCSPGPQRLGWTHRPPVPRGLLPGFPPTPSLLRPGRSQDPQSPRLPSPLLVPDPPPRPSPPGLEGGVKG